MTSQRESAPRASPEGPAAHRAAMNGDPKPLAEFMYGGKESNGLGEGYLYRGWGRGYAPCRTRLIPRSLRAVRSGRILWNRASSKHHY